MIGSVSANRRANAFAQALEEQEFDEAGAAGHAACAAPADSGAAGGTEESLLLALADGLGSLPRPELDAGVKTEQRTRLIAAMESAFAQSPQDTRDTRDARSAHAGRLPGQRGARKGRGTHRAAGLGSLGKLRPRSRLAKGLTAGGLGVGVAASAFGGVAAASSNALPGDSLYGLKLGIEDLCLDLAGDEADQGELHLHNASTRMQEARRLLERTRSGVLDHESLGEVRNALSGMSRDATEGHRLLSAAYERDGDITRMQSLSTFSESTRATWSQVRDRLPVQLSDMGSEVNSVFDAIDSEVGPLKRLFPDPPAESPGDGKPATSDRTGEEQVSSPASSPSPSGGAEGRTGEGSGEPSPSGSQQKDDGLLGGGGLLDPSKGEGEETKPPEQGQQGSGSAEPGAPRPDVTLPPILPNVLPGLHDLPGDQQG